MKITAVRTYIVDGGFRPWTFVKVETSEPGLVGWGDCADWGSPGPVAATVERYAEWVIRPGPHAGGGHMVGSDGGLGTPHGWRCVQGDVGH